MGKVGGEAVDYYDLDTMTRLELYEERERRLVQQRHKLRILAHWSAGILIVTITVTVNYFIM